MASVKKPKRTPATKAKNKATSGLQSVLALAPIEAVTQQIEELADRMMETADQSVDQTMRRACKLALTLIDFQKTTFDNTFDLLAQLQEQSEKMVKELLTNSDWIPGEGKQVVEEWVKTLRGGRAEFRKTVDKSFDLITDYFERVQADGSLPKLRGGAKPKAAKGKAKAKTAAKPKAAAKSKAKPKAKAKAKGKAKASAGEGAAS